METFASCQECFNLIRNMTTIPITNKQKIRNTSSNVKSSDQEQCWSTRIHATRSKSLHTNRLPIAGERLARDLVCALQVRNSAEHRERERRAPLLGRELELEHARPLVRLLSSCGWETRGGHAPSGETMHMYSAVQCISNSVYNVHCTVYTLERAHTSIQRILSQYV